MHIKPIASIEILSPDNKRTITITPRNKNLIITGKNGSGKTTILKKIHQSLVEKLTSGDISYELILAEKLKNLENSDTPPPKKNSDLYYELLKDQETLKRLQENNPFTLEYPFQFDKDFQSQIATIEYFGADRQALISAAAGVSNIPLSQTQPPKIPLDNKLETSLEQHIVNLYVRKAIALYLDKNTKVADSIDSWLKNFEADLQSLTEDSSTTITFDADNFRIFIKQEDKDPYSFQNISSGHSAFLCVFSRLLMRATHLKISPDQLKGVAFIDEIDVHLHVSLQKKILPFLIKSFPNIQFITTTHSPFILTSTDDSIIYDISSGHHVEDLSSYSYEAILEGFFGVHSASEKLQARIKKISHLTNQKKINAIKLSELVDSISPYLDHLDTESKLFYSKARLILTHKKED